jgi:signal transduction histidine kinase
VSYTEAVKRVEDDLSRVSSRLRPVQSDTNLSFSKVNFLAFIAMVINCTSEMERKSQKHYFVVAVAEKYLGVQKSYKVF